MSGTFKKDTRMWLIITFVAYSPLGYSELVKRRTFDPAGKGRWETSYKGHPPLVSPVASDRERQSENLPSFSAVALLLFFSLVYVRRAKKGSEGLVPQKMYFKKVNRTWLWWVSH